MTSIKNIYKQTLTQSLYNNDWNDAYIPLTTCNDMES